jgi:hypothetical protein
METMATKSREDAQKPSLCDFSRLFVAPFPNSGTRRSLLFAPRSKNLASWDKTWRVRIKPGEFTKATTTHLDRSKSKPPSAPRTPRNAKQTEGAEPRILATANLGDPGDLGGSIPYAIEVVRHSADGS